MRKFVLASVILTLLIVGVASGQFKLFGYYANHHYQWSWPHEMDTTAVDIWLQFGTGPTNPVTTSSPWVGVVGGVSPADSITFEGRNVDIAPAYRPLYPPGNAQVGLDMAGGFTRMVHNAGKKILLSYAALQWGAHPNTKDFLDSILAAGPPAIDAHAYGLAGYAWRHGYQGIDINWEFPNANYRTMNAYFITRLRYYLNQWPVRGILTVTVLNSPKASSSAYSPSDTSSSTFPLWYHYGGVFDYTLVEGGFGGPGSGEASSPPVNAILRPNCSYADYCLSDTQYTGRVGANAYTGTLGWASLLRNSGHPEAVSKLIQFVWTEVLMVNHEPIGCQSDRTVAGVPGIVRPITLGMVYGGYAKKPGVTFEFDPVSKARYIYVPQSAGAMFGDWGPIGWWDSLNIPPMINLLKSKGIGGVIMYSSTAGYVNSSGSGDGGNFTSADYGGDRNFVVHTMRTAIGTPTTPPVIPPVIPPIVTCDSATIYRLGFNAGVMSVDVVAPYNRGFVAGRASVDSARIYSSGYTFGYAARPLVHDTLRVNSGRKITVSFPDSVSIDVR